MLAYGIVSAPADTPGESTMYTIVLEKLGPSLEQLVARLPGKKLDAKMTLAVALQMVSSRWYARDTTDIHSPAYRSDDIARFTRSA